MARILYIITLAELGGAQSHVLELVRGFSKQHELHLATSKYGWLTEQVLQYGAHIHIVSELDHNINLLSDLKSFVSLTRLINQINPDLIHAHSSKAGLIARLVGRSLKIPTLFTAHGWGFKPGVPQPRRTLVWLSELIATPLATKIICVSHYDTALAERYLGNQMSRIHTIQNGVIDLPDLKPSAENDAPRDSIRLLMTARFREPKDQQLLISSVARTQMQNIEIVFIGSGSEIEKSRALAQNMGISSRVTFMGDRTDVPELLSQSDVFVLLSRYEGFPISIIEAMRAALPVIATNVGGIPELVDHGITGFLVPTNDIQATAESIRQLANDRSKRLQMGKAGRQKFLQQFRADIMLQKTQAVYAQILEQNPHT